jgi:hypothetical protein
MILANMAGKLRDCFVSYVVHKARQNCGVFQNSNLMLAEAVLCYVSPVNRNDCGY